MPNRSSAFRVRLFVGLGLFIVLAVALLYFTRPMAKVVGVVRSKAVNAVPGSVTVDAEYQMEIKSELGGRIVKTALDDGKHVKKDEFLVQLDTGDLEIEIDQLQNDYEALKSRLAVGSQAQLNLDSAQAAFANVERLHKLGQMSDSDFENQRRALQGIEQQRKLEQVDNQNKIDSAENGLKAKRRQLQKMTITAPFDGVVEKVLARPGDLIDLGAPIAILISTSRTVVARISEEDFAGIRLGQKAFVRFLSYGNQLYNASVSKILPTADPDTQRYEIFLSVDLPLDRLVPGLTGEASIVVGEHENTLIVPRRALFGNSLFIVKNGRVQLRKVSVGYVGLNEAEIIEGVDEGEMVIADEIDRFRDGDRVRTVLLPQ
ncbi:MAG TPA: efflux RND transporter periplasmic adaptor subunit [Opitutaceae bacterium]|jgi:RND family efflux transporter MFP subunit|nr:efflux RND transporter periplasmic adaptor subunit [Opitutaceae bacterium]